VLHALKLRYRIHICFSAHNMATLAKKSNGVIVADNDVSKTGELAAISTGRPYIMPPDVGNDFNDWHDKIGVFRLSQIMRKWIQENLK
jgi:putative DNA primase/helicase